MPSAPPLTDLFSANAHRSSRARIGSSRLRRNTPPPKKPVVGTPRPAEFRSNVHPTIVGLASSAKSPPPPILVSASPPSMLALPPVIVKPSSTALWSTPKAVATCTELSA